MSSMRILFGGDVMAKAGIQAVKRLMPKIIADNYIDFVIINGENAAGGIGITPDIANEFFREGVHVITSGNHIWRQREIRSYISKESRLLRPYNFLEGQPGQGWGIYETLSHIKVGVINLAGQVFMDSTPTNSPFAVAEQALAQMGDAKIILVDFHAEVTSEKRALGFHLDGRVSAVIGTHTHVQTADNQILPGGTAFLTDAGMTGPHDSVIGMRKDIVLGRFRTGMPQSFKPSQKGVRFQGAIVEVDTQTGLALEISRVDVAMDK